MYVFIFLVKVTEWPPIGKIAAHSAYEVFSWYRYLIVSLVFSHLGFWSGNLFLIAPFPDLCLLVPFYKVVRLTYNRSSALFSHRPARGSFSRRLAHMIYRCCIIIDFNFLSSYFFRRITTVLYSCMFFAVNS